jgi:hypothetical protein
MSKSSLEVSCTVSIENLACCLSSDNNKAIQLIEELDDCVCDIAFTELVIITLLKNNRFDLDFDKIQSVIERIRPESNPLEE